MIDPLADVVFIFKISLIILNLLRPIIILNDEQGHRATGTTSLISIRCIFKREHYHKITMIKKREIFRFEETDEVFNNELARYLLNSSLASDREEGRLGKLQDTSSHLKTE